MTGPARRSGGQATPLVLLVSGVLFALVAAVGAFGWLQIGVARAQTAADAAALSAARVLDANLGGMATSNRRGAEWSRRLRASAVDTALASGARLDAFTLVGEAWPPTDIEVRVRREGPLGIGITAVARAGIRDDVMNATTVDTTVGAARGGGYSGPLVLRDGRATCPAAAYAFDAMDASARRDGIDLVVTSGYRTDAEQAVLFARDPDPRWVARPGQSRHRDGSELDISTGGGLAWAWLADNATRFGFVQRYSWEPWHFGYVPGCGGGAPGAPTVIEAMPAWVPPRYRDAVWRAASAEGVPPRTLAALLAAESGFDARAVSRVGALGIAQFTPATARSLGLRDPFDADAAIAASARLLARHVTAFGSMTLALAAYNAGPGAVRRYGGVPPYAETVAYVRRILALVGTGTDASSGLTSQDTARVRLVPTGNGLT